MRSRLVAIAAACLVVYVGGWWLVERQAVPGATQRVPALLTAVGLSLVVPALVGLRRRPHDRVPVRMAVAGLLLPVGYFRLLEPAWAATLGAAVWYTSPLALLAVAVDRPWPGRPAAHRLPAMWAVPMGLAAAFVVTSGPRRPGGQEAVRSASWVFFDEQRQVFVRQANPLAWWPSGTAVRLAWLCWAVWVVGVASAAVVGVLRRPDRGRGAQRRSRTLVVAAAVPCAAVAVLAWPERLGPSAAHSVVLGRWYSDLLTIVPVVGAAVIGTLAVWSELVQPRLSRSRDGALQLDPDTTPSALRRTLVRTLGDPTARLLFASGDGWLDEHGRPTPLAAEPHRAATIVTRSGDPVAAVEHDVSLVAQPDLVTVATLSIALSVDGRRLAALAERDAEDARASAARLLAAADAARCDTERRIAEGPGATLAEVAALLAGRPVPLDRVHDGLRRALVDVRTIAHGSTPLSLTEEGLSAALDDLAGASPVPLAVSGFPAARLPRVLEVTIYRVVADAVAGAGGPVVARLSGSGDQVVVHVEGPAGPLDQLVIDRIETVGGSVSSAPGVLTVTLPLAGG